MIFKTFKKEVNHMAKQNGAGAKLLTHLTFRDEARNEPAKLPEIGRFKFFRQVFKTYTTPLFVMNLMTALCALPILFLIGYVAFTGIENFSYAASGFAQGDVPYFMGNIGMGLSSATTLAQGSVILYQGFRVLFIACGIFAPLIGIGYSGLQHVVNKMMWLEKFPVKYGKIGNPIPRVYREFFVGIKQNWWETMLCFAAAGGMFIGVSLAYLNLLERLALGTATAWSWVGVVFATIAALVVFLTLCTLIPSIPQYHGKLNFLQKIKNSLILDVGMIMPLVFMLGLICGVTALCSINTFFNIIGIVLAASLGFACITLMQSNFMQYTAANVITPGWEVVSKNKANPKNKGAKKSAATVKTVKSTDVQKSNAAAKSAEAKQNKAQKKNAARVKYKKKK